MKLRSSIAYSLAPWLFYFIGETVGHLAIGSGIAIFTMMLCQSLRWYRLKWTDWTQCLYFTIVLLAVTWPVFNPALAFRSLLAPALFLMMAFGSLALGHPFTNQFAKEEIPPDFWNDPAFPYHFIRVNTILTSAWGINFGVALICAWFARQETPIHPWAFRGIVMSSFMAVGALTRFLPSWYETHVYRPNPSAQALPKVEV